ncbi:MAG: hypothetical protein ACE5IY_07670 [bacterium]
MQFDLLTRFRQMKEGIQGRFHRRVTPRGALGISLLLHVFFGAALGSYWVGARVAQQARHADEIVFDLQTIKENPDLSGQQRAQASEEYGLPNREALEASGRASSVVKGNMNRDAVVTASLAALSDLRDSFTFITHAVAADSVGGFSPVNGDVPGSEYDSFGRKKGEGVGAGGVSVVVGGSGFCPSPGIR